MYQMRGIMLLADMVLLRLMIEYLMAHNQDTQILEMSQKDDMHQDLHLQEVNKRCTNVKERQHFIANKKIIIIEEQQQQQQQHKVHLLCLDTMVDLHHLEDRSMERDMLQLLFLPLLNLVVNVVDRMDTLIVMKDVMYVVVVELLDMLLTRDIDYHLCMLLFRQMLHHNRQDLWQPDLRQDYLLVQDMEVVEVLQCYLQNKISVDCHPHNQVLHLITPITLNSVIHHLPRNNNIFIRLLKVGLVQEVE